MIEALISPDNPIVFILDPKSESIDVPGYINGQLVAVSRSCVSVGTRPNFEGETKIQLVRSAQHIELDGMVKVFVGGIKAATNTLGIVSSDFELLASVTTVSESPAFEVWVDDETAPARVTVRLCE